jgi:HSP20 family molecular chaperone IbpA
MTSRDPGKWMLAEALQLLQQADRLHRQFFELRPARIGGACWEPPIDVFETEHELLILVALLGVTPAKVEVLIDGDSLLVIGERPMPAPAGAAIHRLEIPYGRFERRIGLPAGRFEIGERDLVNGCLLLKLRKLA